MAIFKNEEERRTKGQTGWIRPPFPSAYRWQLIGDDQHVEGEDDEGAHSNEDANQCGDDENEDDGPDVDESPHKCDAGTTGFVRPTLLFW